MNHVRKDDEMMFANCNNKQQSVGSVIVDAAEEACRDQAQLLTTFENIHIRLIPTFCTVHREALDQKDVSRVVRESYKNECAKDFCCGKFDQYQQQVSEPFSAIVSAFSQLCG